MVRSGSCHRRPCGKGHMYDNISAAITAARTGAQLDAIARDITAAWGKGNLGDDEFTRLYGLAHRQRAELKASPATGRVTSEPRRSIFPPRRPQRSPDRRRSIERR